MVRRLVAVGAGFVLVVVLYQQGLANFAGQLRTLGIVLPILVVTGFGRLLLQTRAWAIALRADGIAVPQLRLIAVRLSSQAAGYFMALGPVVSEPAKLVLLRKSVDVAAAAPATFFEAGAFWFSTMILGLAGACSAAFLIGNARAVWVAVAVMGFGLWFLVRKQSLLSPIVQLAGARAPKWLHTAEATERQIRSFRGRQRQIARKVLFLDSISQLVTLAEVAGVLWVAGIRCTFLQVLTIEAGIRVVKILGAWVPGRIGADEGGSAASFALLGLSPVAGLLLALARRVRDLLWCAAGIVWAATSQSHPPACRTFVTCRSTCQTKKVSDTFSPNDCRSLH